MSVSSQVLTKVTAAEWEAFEKFLSYFPNIDEFLMEIGETFEVYNRMLTDEEIGSALEIRKRALLSYPWNISSADKSMSAKKTADFVKQALRNPDFSLTTFLEQCLTALEFGYAVVEIVWKDPAKNKGLWLPKKTVLLKPDRFRISPDDSLVMIIPEEKRLPEKYKFVLHRFGIAPENPYGVSVLKRCYWPWRFKRAGWEFWLLAAEKFGVPSIMAIIDTENARTTAEIEERARFIAEALKNLKVDGAVALAGTKEIKTIEAKNIGDFEKLIELCNRAISKAITGQVLATGEGKYGTRAQATVHENVLYEIVDADARALAETVNRTLIKWIVELNFGEDAPCPVFEFDLSEETPWERIRDAIDRGIPLSKKALYQTYGLPQPESEEDMFISPKAGGLVFADRKEFAEEEADFFGSILPRRKFHPIW